MFRMLRNRALFFVDISELNISAVKYGCDHRIYHILLFFSESEALNRFDKSVHFVVRGRIYLTQICEFSPIFQSLIKFWLNFN